ncbi:hypothetical protein TRFO_04453 [Tritrichomonas foetus]|uniref:Tubby C-terminal domain-containing protein n=1 Tax=Tritrichomonas foetus TaxID=1144522 RepID=A0A1J4KJN5_9EUKA|nr:hypothetical protein TRFO_04453 [Tritrichomonas foetus]|eukprot:OHT09902.1 hypothetical protein TRFO_04453 [Tritrichomonas foetus]
MFCISLSDDSDEEEDQETKPKELEPSLLTGVSSSSTETKTQSKTLSKSHSKSTKTDQKSFSKDTSAISNHHRSHSIEDCFTLSDNGDTGDTSFISPFLIQQTCSQNVVSKRRFDFADEHAGGINIRKEKSHQVVSQGLNPNLNPNTFPTYHLIARRKYRETGKTARYVFTDGNKAIYEARQNRKHIRIFDIFTASQFDSPKPPSSLNQDIVASLIMDENGKEFSFRKYNRRGPQILEVKFAATSSHYYRSATVTFMYSTSSEKKPQRLRTKTPNFDNDGKPVFEFEGNKFYMDSPRNMNLYSRHQNKTYISIRKTDSKELEIDIFFRANLLFLVAISLADAISPVC